VVFSGQYAKAGLRRTAKYKLTGSGKAATSNAVMCGLNLQLLLDALLPRSAAVGF